MEKAEQLAVRLRSGLCSEVGWPLGRGSRFWVLGERWSIQGWLGTWLSP